MLVRYLITLCTTALLVACTPREVQVTGDLAITNARILTMGSVHPLEEHSLIIRDGLIVAIGPTGDLDVSGAVQRIDAAGATLMPSFVDTHVHLCDSDDLITFLAYGVGAVRNMEGTPYILLMRDAVAAGEIPGPMVRSTGPYTNAPAIADAAAARAAVTEQAARGYDAIKIHGPLSLDALTALGDAAAAHGLPVIGHVPRDQALDAVLATGVMSEISHAEEYLYTLLAHRDDVDHGAVIEEAVRLTVESGISVTATLTTYHGIAQQAADVEQALAELPLAQLSPFSVRSFRPRSNRYARRFSSGDSLHREMQELVASGLTEYQALAAASRDGWDTLTGGTWDGVIEVGAPAELVLIGADPLTDIRATRDVLGLVRAGRWHSGERLHADSDALARTRASQQAFVDHLWDNTLEDALPWLAEQRAAGSAPDLSPAILRCQAQRATWDGVPEVALQALDLIDEPSAIDEAYRREAERIQAATTP
jgi:imidazolonepropionase-like amidohydrolase